ncbi:MAG: hypothetical protein HYX26_09220 [Acidobacteriales bacterium]|nr:hypothetical protein [Terriglobales bacterium]
MKTLFATLLFLSLLVVFAQEKPAPSASVSQLAWMSGSWKTTNGPAEIEEHWTTPAGNMMVGMGRTVVKGNTRYFEYFRIIQKPDGIFYVAQPKGAPPTEFKLVKSGENEVVFENLAHDFPKRIMYRKESDGGLTARIEGTPEQKKMEEEFRYRPMK